MVRVGILNYGVGNVGSIANAIARVGGEAVVVNSPLELKFVDALILPGVGSFDAALEHLGPYLEGLNSLRGSVPMLGICLGLQLMFEGSEEGVKNGLSWYRGWARRVRGPRTPHIGWDLVRLVRPCSLIEESGHYYFMHSYAVLDPSPDVPYAGLTNYGGWVLSLLCDEGRLTYGTQFHPEKSGKGGLALLRRFLGVARK